MSLEDLKRYEKIRQRIDKMSKEDRIYYYSTRNLPDEVMRARICKYMYRSNNITENVFKILGLTLENYMGVDCECNFFLMIIFLPELLLELIFTIIPYILGELKKPVFKPEEEYKLDRNTQKESSQDEVIDFNIEIREKYNSLKDQYYPDKDSKNYKASLINNLRKYLFTNNFTLKVKKLPNGYYTFYSMNRILSNIFPELIQLKTDFLSGVEWIENLNMEELENKIKGMLQVDIKIIYS